MSETTKKSLYGMTLAELQQLCDEIRLPRFTAKQIARWLYVARITDISQMTNLSLAARELLSQNYTASHIEPIKVSTSVDGTKKYLFPTLQGQYIESAYIPDGD